MIHKLREFTSLLQVLVVTLYFKLYICSRYVLIFLSAKVLIFLLLFVL